VFLCLVCSVVSHDSVFDFVQPTSRSVVSSIESEEENIYDCPRPARGLLPCVFTVEYCVCIVAEIDEQLWHRMRHWCFICCVCVLSTLCLKSLGPCIRVTTHNNSHEMFSQ